MPVGVEPADIIDEAHLSQSGEIKKLKTLVNEKGLAGAPFPNDVDEALSKNGNMFHGSAVIFTEK